MTYSISDVARTMRIRPSAIRYYESIGLLPAPQRKGGRRRYDAAILDRLAVVQRARALGFTLDEIRELLFGFAPHTPAARRWRELADRKLAEVEAQLGQLRTVQEMLLKMQRVCICESFERCGRGILQSDFPTPATV